ncbi:hypothetical protein PT974_05433 [Cladobotryum mycophilum]|uniref:F-box domain-containing protein n=1 Tax=Cladobotryum mycophilum TaxID=491253 RepID=A0ABR0SIN9_9HYPO
MEEQETLPAALDDILCREWPDVGCLTLQQTYEQLHRLHAVAHIITPQAPKNGDGDASDRVSVDSDNEEEQCVRGNLDNEDPKTKNGKKRLGRGEKKPVPKTEPDPYHEARLETLECIKLRRDALWTRAMTLSREHIRPLHILNLPEEILQRIFLHFQAPDISSMSRIQWEEDHRPKRAKRRRRNVQNARLVCRLFNELASPHLSPYLKVQIDKALLNRFEAISQRPHLAKGVCGIWVGLQYRPREMATSLP